MENIQPVKTTPNGRALLNLGCGTLTHEAWNNVDFSLYARLADKKRLAKWLHRLGILSDTRYQRLLDIDPDIVHWDLTRGIPYKNNTFDVVYQSHFLAHVRQHEAEEITRECYRVLKPGGIHRIALVDLEYLIDLYTDATDRMEENEDMRKAKDQYEEALYHLFDLSVPRKYSRGMAQQSPGVRFLERLIRGGPAENGELRFWHYDQYNLAEMLEEVGFEEIERVGPRESRVSDWNRFRLDIGENGQPRKDYSFWMEAVKKVELPSGSD